MNKMITMAKSTITLKPLKGYRTYLAVVAGIIVAGLKAQGYIDENTYQIALSVLGMLGLAALRAAK